MEKHRKIISYILFSLLGIYFIYDYFIYNPYYSINDFGLNYNEFRQKNNIPLLPPDWIPDTVGKYGIDNFHSPQMDKIGHQKKYINTLKSEIGAEMDKFYLGNDSVINSRFERNTGNKYIYFKPSNLSGSSEFISNKQANELLEKKGIEFRFDDSWSMNLK